MSGTEADVSMIILIVGGAMILVGLGALALVFMRAEDVNLTESDAPEEKPEWMSAMPPKETVAASMADGEGVTLYDHDEGEKLAAPFAEQIEDVLRAKIENDPALKALNVDFGTAPDGGLEIWMDGEKFVGVANLPDERLKAALLQAVREWNSRK